jgi:hypothetical protein
MDVGCQGTGGARRTGTRCEDVRGKKPGDAETVARFRVTTKSTLRPWFSWRAAYQPEPVKFTTPAVTGSASVAELQRSSSTTQRCSSAQQYRPSNVAIPLRRGTGVLHGSSRLAGPGVAELVTSRSNLRQPVRYLGGTQGAGLGLCPAVRRSARLNRKASRSLRPGQRV